MGKRLRVLGIVMLAVFLSLAGLPQPAANAGTDTTPPTGTIVINSNRSATNTPNVTLALTWEDGVSGSGVSRMRFSDDGSHWTAWEVLTATRAYTLPTGDAHKTVRVQYLDKANNRSAIYSDYILLDTTPPTGSIIINKGDATTSSRNVSLGLTFSDAGSGVSRMRFSDNGSTWTSWLLPAATRVHTLPEGLGYHTVRVQYLDGAGNYSLTYNDYIKLVDPAAGTTETVMLPGSIPFEMVWIPAGSFLMGRYTDEENSEYQESPQHSVSVAGFWLGKYPVTKAQWTAVAGSTPWVGQSDPNLDPNSPAIYLSWDTVQAFIGGFNTLLGKTYHLPSESQWEYACRAGAQTRFYWGDDLDYALIGDYAWYAGNCYPDNQYAHNVGLKLPNKWGLYDMSGNVWEWCQDTWHDTYAGAPADGTAWGGEGTTARVVRGGMYNENAWISRSAKRGNYAAWGAMTTVGFRLAR